MAWIAAVLLVDAVDPAIVPGLGDGPPSWFEPARQAVLGVGTWLVLVGVLRRESALVRVQTGLVVLFATAVEYTFSPLLEAYVYRIGTVPPFVPPGHGLVYLAALWIGRSPVVRAHARLAVALTVLVGGAWAVIGLMGGLGGRHDVLGWFWFLCLLAFLRWGRSRLLYVGAFVVVGFLELTGTALGTWTWAEVDPVLGLIGQGNPPSGAAGGYGWFDLYALLLAPRVLVWWRARARYAGSDPRGASTASTSSCSNPLVAKAFPPEQPSAPSSDVNRPPASVTTGTNAAMS